MPDATKTSENLLIRPTKARQLLGGTSPAFFWKTILPQLRSFRLGRARWIEMKSVHEFIARQLAGAPQEQARVDAAQLQAAEQALQQAKVRPERRKWQGGPPDLHAAPRREARTCRHS